VSRAKKIIRKIDNQAFLVVHDVRESNIVRPRPTCSSIALATWSGLLEIIVIAFLVFKPYYMLLLQKHKCLELRKLYVRLIIKPF
jgi:hypothetical protein